MHSRAGRSQVSPWSVLGPVARQGGRSSSAAGVPHSSAPRQLQHTTMVNRRCGLSINRCHKPSNRSSSTYTMSLLSHFVGATWWDSLGCLPHRRQKYWFIGWQTITAAASSWWTTSINRSTDTAARYEANALKTKPTKAVSYYSINATLATRPLRVLLK